MKLVNGRSCLGNVALEDLAGEYGTPIYVYDGNKIEAQYKLLSESFTGIPLKIKYACKANTNINLLKLVKRFGSELDTVSIQEVK
ncbi:MAG: diaminopimelate decarboxylase, partial [Bacteroidota bacterium]|nr:diaminopimelate decarboxylase [Bacteroidota bacterium]